MDSEKHVQQIRLAILSVTMMSLIVTVAPDVKLQ